MRAMVEGAYPRRVTLSAVDARGPRLLAVVLVAWVAAARPNSEPRIEPSSPPMAEAVAPGTGLLLTTPDRPVLLGMGKLAERQLVTMAKANGASWGGSVLTRSQLLDPPPLIAVEPFASGLAGRGPPGKRVPVPL